LVKGERILGPPVIINKKLFFSKETDDKVIHSVLMNIDTLDYIGTSVIQKDNLMYNTFFNVNNVIHIDKDYAAIIVEKEKNLSCNKIVIFNIVDMKCVGIIKGIDGIEREKFSVISNHDNGFVTVSKLYQINIYNYI